MPSSKSRPPTTGERRLLRILYAGFAAVIGLLGLAGLLAVLESSRIQAKATQLARNQLLVTELFRGIEHEQAALAAALRHLGQPRPDAGTGLLLLRQLEDSSAQLMRTAESVRSSLPDAPWAEMRLAVGRFRQGARDLLQQPEEMSASEIAALFAEEQRVAALFSQLLEAQIEQLNTSEAEIEKQSRRLAATSAGLVGAGFVLALACAVASLRTVRSNIRRIEWQADALNAVSWHMLEHQEAAARRFAHELHDELGQSLAVLRGVLSRPTTGINPDLRDSVLRQVDGAIANVRDLSQLLRPVILDDLGLDAALRWLVEGFSERTGIDAQLHSNLERRLPDAVETHVFRIVQEALTNIARHSRATRFRIDVDCTADTLTLELEDNGIGISGAVMANGPSLGIIGMQARARQCDGELNIEPGSDNGLRLRLRIPVGASPE